MKYIDCNSYSRNILDLVRERRNGKALMILSAGSNPAAESYTKGKLRDCEYCGIPVIHRRVSSQRELLWEIELANANDAIGGIIVQLPLPAGFNEAEASNAIQINKDVDGFRCNSPFKPCTTEGIMYLLHKELGDLTGKRALIIGRGRLVGIPMFAELLSSNCTVTVAHSKTRNLNAMLLDYDIIVSATGTPGLINLKRCNAKVVIDAGVSRGSNGKLCGDCYNFDPNDNSNMKVTPVPGGVGLMARAMLMAHVGGVKL